MTCPFSQTLLNYSSNARNETKRHGKMGLGLLSHSPTTLNELKPYLFTAILGK